MGFLPQTRTITGTAQATNSAANATVIAATGAGTKLSIIDATISVEPAAAGGSGQVLLQDGSGGGTIFIADADAVGVYRLHFDYPGYPLSANTLLNINVANAVTTQASARCTALCAVLGG